MISAVEIMVVVVAMVMAMPAAWRRSQRAGARTSVFG